MNTTLENQVPNGRKETRHMGKMVQKAVENSRMSVINFSKAIHCSRTNVYSIFGRQQIDINRLRQISSVLNLRVSDFIIEDKNDFDKYLTVVELDGGQLEELLNRKDLTNVKYWKIA